VFVPRGVAPLSASLAIAAVSHLFVSPTEGRAETMAKTGESGSCNVDLICESAGNAALANIGKSVARMVFTEGASSYLCTGTLIGATDASPAPYFYSAAHCISTQAAASTLTTHCSSIEPVAALRHESGLQRRLPRCHVAVRERDQRRPVACGSTTRPRPGRGSPDGMRPSSPWPPPSPESITPGAIGKK
jgi:hypothetical protein